MNLVETAHVLRLSLSPKLTSQLIELPTVTQFSQSFETVSLWTNISLRLFE